MMTYELKTNPKMLALATVGAAVLGMPLDDALLRPVVVPVGKSRPNMQPKKKQTA